MSDNKEIGKLLFPQLLALRRLAFSRRVVAAPPLTPPCKTSPPAVAVVLPGRGTLRARDSLLSRGWLE